MMARGGNRKRRLNDMLQLAGAGGFRGHIIRNAARRGIHIMLVDAGDTSNECALCSFVSRESRISRDSFVCVKCGDESHADLNAACVILKRGLYGPVDRAEGRPVQRRRAGGRKQPTRRPAWPRRRGLDPPHVRWGRQKITQLEIQSRL
jgi:transposase